MTDKISLFNYEAYYLDYLEGSLNNEDKALFLAFLEAHPECKLMDEELPELETSTVFLSDSFKKSLLEPSLLDEITETNCNYFLISAAEGLLSDEKRKELTQFVAKHGLEEDLSAYQATRLTADTNLIYPDKQELMQREKVLVLWPYLLAAAASLVLVLMVIRIGSQAKVDSNLVPVAHKKMNKPTNEINRASVLQKVIPKQEMESAELPPENLSQPDKKHSEGVKAIQPGQLNTRPLIEIELPGPEPIAKKIMEQESKFNEVETQDLASNSFSTHQDEMRNPIKPITKFISEKTNTPVDFKTGKSAGKSNGFFLKIGRIEVSHKKH